MLKFRKSVIFFLCAPLLCVFCDAAPKRSAQSDVPANPPVQAQPAQPMQPMQPAEDCSSLTADEQQFAYGLTSDNRAMFCSKFNPVQRAAAMQLTSQPDPTGALLSPDQAVAKVAVANNIKPPKKSSSGCPVK